MQPDLLQQLRDLHLPTEPVWWPPAPGWWILAALLVAALALLIRELAARHRRRAPFRAARSLYAELYDGYRKGQLAPELFLHQSNELLKRLVIFAVGEGAARSANDEAWLELLDGLSGSNAFTAGPGRQLGNQRFRAAPEADIEALHPVLMRFFAGARPS